MTAPPMSRAPGARRGATRPSPAARRFGYLVAIAVNLAVLGVVFVRPGWQAVPFLDDDTPLVLPWVAAQIWVSVAVNLVWLVADPRWLRALGELVTSVVGVVAVARILQVFPFAFDEGSVWPTVAGVLLWVGLVGSALGALVNLARFVRTLAAPHDPAWA